MKQESVLSIILLMVIAGLPVVAQQTTNTKPVSSFPPPQVFQGRLEIKIVSITSVQEWKMFPSIPANVPNVHNPTLQPKDGEDLLVVKFEAKDIKSGEINKEESFEEFELEDQKGNKYKSRLLQTDIREIPFGLPKDTRLKSFRVAGLTFDLERLAVTKGQ